jgi:hypothetical protein
MKIVGGEQFIKQTKEKKSLKVIILYVVMGIIIIIASKACSEHLQKSAREIDPNWGKSVDEIRQDVKREYEQKSTYDKNMDLMKEMDRMEQAQRLDRMSEEQEAVNKYRR